MVDRGPPVWSSKAGMDCSGIPRESRMISNAGIGGMVISVWVDAFEKMLEVKVLSRATWRSIDIRRVWFIL